jgi:superfamily II RNA helicase
MEKLGGGLWLNFKRHLRFLREVGFVDSDNRLTPDGHWATKLRLDQPLLIAEAIRNGAMTGVETNILTACLASFVWDKTQEREMGPKVTADLARLKQAFDRLVNSIRWIRTLKAKRGFDSPPILFWPAAALYLWARGNPWEQLLDRVPIDEGDMASLIMRTADHLRQVANLRETHSSLARMAEKGIGRILREPVYVA